MPVRREVVPGGPDALAARAAVWIADRLWSAIAARGQAHLALSGGSTPGPMFAALARMPALPWPSVHVWQVVERVAPPDHPDRNARALRARLLDAVPVVAHLMPVEDDDLEQAAARYAGALHEACRGVLDVVHLGIGDDGHTASWPPGDPVLDETRGDVALSGEYAGRARMTLTVPCVNRARAIAFVVAGAAKAPAVAALARGDARLPAARVRDDATLLLDEEAASGSGS